MKVEKRMKGKVVCKAERIRFTTRQKFDLINEWDEVVKVEPGLTYEVFASKRNHLQHDTLRKLLIPPPPKPRKRPAPLPMLKRQRIDRAKAHEIPSKKTN